MGIEIERKFLVAGDYRPFATGSLRIVQGYLSSVPERSVRVRILDDRGYLAIKGAGNETGATRFEWEREIPLAEAEELLRLCEPGVIEKTRSLVPVGDHVFEVDEFHGENEGLVMAEVELADEDEAFAKPEWLGEEVTGRAEYYNTSLMKRPFRRW
jgi:adenylate cyclase